MLTVVLSTITKNCKQSKCSLTDEWIKKLWYIYIKLVNNNRKNLPVKEAIWMNLKRKKPDSKTVYCYDYV